MDIEKDFCSKEQSEALTKLGFNKECHRGWYRDGSLEYHPDSDIILDNPTYSQAFRFFREKYSLHPRFVSNEHFASYHFDYEDKKIFDNFRAEKYKNYYEKAESACLDKLIKITQNK